MPTTVQLVKLSALASSLALLESARQEIVDTDTGALKQVDDAIIALTAATDAAIIDAVSATDAAILATETVNNDPDIFLLDKGKVGYSELNPIFEPIEVEVYKNDVEKLQFGELIPVPVRAASAVPNPPTSMRYLFFNSSNANLLSSKDSSGTVTAI